MRSKKPLSSSDEIGVYERTTSFSAPLGVAASDICWPMGKPRMSVGRGRPKR